MLCDYAKSARDLSFVPKPGSDTYVEMISERHGGCSACIIPLRHSIMIDIFPPLILYYFAICWRILTLGVIWSHAQQRFHAQACALNA